MHPLLRVRLCRPRLIEKGVRQMTKVDAPTGLDLAGTPVTDAGVKSLQKSLPNCRIERREKEEPNASFEPTPPTCDGR